MKRVLFTAVLAALGTQGLEVNASSTPVVQKQVTTSAKVKVSKPVRELESIQKITPQRKTKLTASGEPIPGVDLVKEVPNHFPFAKKLNTEQKGKQTTDPVLQTQMGKKGFESLAPEIGANFDGMTNPQGYVPPDTNGSVGPNHYVQTVNVSLAIWDKDGTELVSPVAINSLWAGFGGICETNNNGDPIVLYDRRADRWMISQFALASGDNHQCIAISQTGDPTGAYYLYDFPYGELMNDYPHFGIFGDAYYMGVNQFGAAGWAGGGVAAYERDKMLVGAEAQQVIISGQGFSPEVFTPMPLDVDGVVQPPVDMNQLFVWADGEGQSKLHVWEMDLDWSDPAATTFTAVAELDVAAFTSPANATQPNGEELDALGIRSMFRTSYRNIGGDGKILFTHNIAGPAGQPVARWYQLDVDHANGNAVSVNQQGTFSPDTALAPSTAARWMASGAMDASGNIAIGYTVSGADNFPSIHAATRLASDPAGTLTEEFVLVEGGGSQGAVNRGRWADYASMSVDPVDDCTFWYTNEYYKAENNGTLTWSTYISSFKLPSCTMGPTGEISGTVTDAASGDPIANAIVSAGNISTVTRADGGYTLLVPVGDYDMSVSRYGWVAGQQSGVAVAEDDELTNNFALEGADQVELTGSVTDLGQGWPLYARVSASVPGDTIVTYTNPETGAYVLPVFEGTTITVTARSEEFGGYSSNTIDVMPTADTLAPMALNFTLATDGSCTAPGYQFVEPAFAERFEGASFPPQDWTVTDDIGDGVVWSSAEAGIGNITGTNGDAALANSDAAGPGANADTSLISPTINVADISTTTLKFVGHYRTYTGADQVDLDINVDGAGWVNVTALNTGTEAYEIDLSTQLSGATSFQLRWRYYNANWEWYTSIDDVTFGDGTCVPVAGEVVSGYITDTNTGTAINNANILVDGVLVTGSTMTDSDAALEDGFVHLFVPAGAEMTVEAPGYRGKDIETAEVTLATPVSLDAGQLSTDSEALTPSLTQGRSETMTVDLSNSGSADADYSVLLVKAAGELPNGPFHQSTRHMGPKDMENMDASKIRYFPAQTVSQVASVDALGYFPTAITYGWGISVDRASNEFYVGDLAAAGAPADVIWKYDSNGVLTGDTIAIDFAGSFFADSAFNQRTGMLWQVNVGAGDCIHEIDTANMAVTGNTICPEFGLSQRGLAYDPLTDTFYAGSWSDGVIHQFTTDGTIVRSINTGLPVAGLAFNSSTGHLFASLNNGGDNYDVMVLDANTETLDPINGIDVNFDLDGDGYAGDLIQSQAGLDIDCDGNLWIVDQGQQVVVGFATGEAGVCDIQPSWASTEGGSGSLAVDESANIEIALNANAEAGEYYASLIMLNNTPYGSLTVPVTLTVTEPQYGQFAVTAVEVDEADVATVTVTRTDGADFAVSVDYATVNGTAFAGEHFQAANGTLSWDDLDVDSKTFTVQTNQLGDIHEDLTFAIELSNPQGGAAIDSDASTADVTIVDLANGQLQFAVTGVEVDENGTAELTVARLDGANFAVSVDFTTVDGSAIAGTHYTGRSGTLTWDDQDSAAKTITVSLSDVDANKNFSVSLSNATGGAQLGTAMSATVTIKDKPKGSGSMGGSLLMLVALAGLLRRRKA